MNRNRQLPTVAFLILLALASWEASRRAAAFIARLETSDDLAWIRRQYHPDTAHWQAIQSLHRRHRETRDALARELEQKSRALASILDREEAITPTVQALLDEVGILRGRCHVAALRHTLEISRQLSPVDSRLHRMEVEHQLLGLEPEWHPTEAPRSGLADLKRHSILAD